ncbi:MAG: patatin-like phospholipase family protein [Gammaproteobacteria bacterium]
MTDESIAPASRPSARTPIRLITGGLLLTVLSSPLFSSAAAAEEDFDLSSPPTRPRIGLALGGGGAKGAAHVGVLAVLDELRIPIDCIVGTSMGALVGGVYAGGMPADVLERTTLEIDWSRTVGSADQRKYQPITRKLDNRTYTNNIELGIKDGKLKGKAGLLQTQKIEDLIRDLVTEARMLNDFDELPIPFRAIATDMVSGEMVVMDSGDISVAMRASMAVPGAFSPIVVGDRVLSDGGMTRNLPVDVARDLCADVVIAVWLTRPQPGPGDLESALALVSRSTDVMIKANEKAQIATLTERDVGIEVPMGDITSSSFERAPDAVELGRAAAQAAAQQLRRYSLPEDDYWAWRRTVTTTGSNTSRLAEVRIVGLDRVDPRYVEQQLRHLKAGAIVTSEQVNQDTDRIYALGDFDKVSTILTGPREARVLEIRPIEKPWGPNFFSADLGLMAETSGELMAILRVDHDRTWFNSRGGRWQNTAQIGRQTILMTDFYQPFDVRQRFFIQPSLKWESDLQDIYLDGEREARYFLSQLRGALDLGMNFGTRAQLRTGAKVGWIDTRRDTGDVLLPELDREGESNVYAGAVYDTRDNIGLTTDGSYLNAKYANSGSWLGGEQDYSVAEGVITRAFRLGDDTLNVVAAGGAELSGDLPVTRDFLLGGIRSFPGLNLNELRGTSYWVAGGNYRFKLKDIVPLFSQTLFAGLRLQAGRVGGRRDGALDGTLYGLSGSVSGRTVVGPFLISLGYVSNDSWALQLALGRPLPEGTVLDEIN